MRLRDGLGELTYCTNIHPGERWADCLAALSTFPPAIKQALCPDAPFGLGLRLSARAARDLSAPGALSGFRALLAERDLYVVTMNGFPYGRFHGTRVKTDVYRPDWRRQERLDYTLRLAGLMAELVPEGTTASISTVPAGWAADLADEDAVAAVGTLLIHAVAGLEALHRRTGRLITLALEPEPGCLLDTTPDALPLFRRLRGAGPRTLLRRLTGLPAGEAEAALTRHLGLCLDLCHMAVGFEDPAASLALLEAENIPVHKLQLSAGLRLEPADAPALAAFDDGVYLHQVSCRRGDRILRFPDLAPALASDEARRAEEWRVHFHVPLWAGRFDRLTSTTDVTAAALAIHAARPIAPHLEVETYTWDVLPAEYRREDPTRAITRELQWVLKTLGV